MQLGWHANHESGAPRGNTSYGASAVRVKINNAIEMIGGDGWHAKTIRVGRRGILPANIW